MTSILPVDQYLYVEAGLLTNGFSRTLPFCTGTLCWKELSSPLLLLFILTLLARSLCLSAIVFVNLLSPRVYLSTSWTF